MPGMRRGVDAGGTVDRRSAGLSRRRLRQALPRLSARSRRQQALRASPTGAVSVEIVSENKSHGGRQLVVEHASSATSTDMTFSIFLPPQAERASKLPVVWYLSGLTCTHANVTEKGEYRAACAELGLIFVAPDTSPRGDGRAGRARGAWDFGLGAGFYVDATQEPWASNYRMWTYVTEELPALVAAEFPADMDRQGITGHSMGGHGALTVALRHPGPLPKRLGLRADRRAGAGAVGPEGARRLSRRRPRGLAQARCRRADRGRRARAELLVDVGDADPFIEKELRPELLERACAEAGIPLTLRRQPGYDHSYYFISTFMADHLRWHAERLKRG